MSSATNHPWTSVSLLDESPLGARENPCPILIADDLPMEAVRAFHGAFSDVAVLPVSDQTVLGLLQNVAGARVIVTTVKYALDDAFFRSLPDSVQIVALYSAGHDHVDIDAARRCRKTVIYTPNVLADSVADLAMALLLGAARRVVEGLDLIRTGKWSGFSPTLLLGKELRGQVLGIFGMGSIGREVSVRAQAFGMNVAYRSRSQLPRSVECGARFVADDREFLGCCDMLLLSAPSTPLTHKFLNAERISWLKPGAVVINVSRGELVDDQALIEALQSGHVAAAGLDVFENEPAIDPRYLGMPRVFPLPHIGSATLEARIAMADALVEGIERILVGEEPSNRLA